MTASPMPADQARPVPWFALALLVLGTVGFAAAWVAVAMLSESHAAWMAPLAALDVAWLLRLGGARPGATRMWLAIAGTVVSVALANWSIIAAHMAGMMGLGFLDSALRLGPSLAWTLSGLANGAAGLAWTVAAVAVAAIAAR